MPTLPSKEVHPAPLREMIDVNEKKRQLEDLIRTVDSRSKLFTESAAQREIEAYKRGHGIADAVKFPMMTDNLRKPLWKETKQ